MPPIDILLTLNVEKKRRRPTEVKTMPTLNHKAISMLTSELIKNFLMCLLNKRWLTTKMWNEWWTKKKKMKRKHCKGRKSIDSPTQSSWLSSAGTERKRDVMLKHTTTLIPKMDKIWTSSQNGTKEERFWLLTSKISTSKAQRSKLSLSLEAKNSRTLSSTPRRKKVQDT